MQYNIYFEVASIPFVLIMILFHYIKYNNNTVVNRRFRVLAWLSFACIFLDSLTAVTITYYTRFPLTANILLNTLYFALTIYTSYYFSIPFGIYC